MTHAHLWKALTELTDPLADHTEHAVRTLLDGGAASVEPLALTLRIGNPFARRQAARLLGQVGGENAVAPLLDALQDRETAVRNAAVEALSHIGPGVVPELLALLPADDFARAAGLMRRMPETATAMPILEWLGAQEQMLRAAVLETLGRIDDPRCREPLILALRDANSDIRFLAAQGLARQGADCVPLLLAALDDDLLFRQQVAELLLPYGEAAQPAFLLASHVGRTPVRWVADTILSQLDSEEAQDTLSHALSDADPSVRLVAIESLRTVKESVIPSIIAALKDDSAEVRRAAVRLLGPIPDPRITAALVEVSNDSDPEVRSLALHAVGNLTSVQELGPLLNAMTSRDSTLRATAANLLASMPPAQVVDPLLASLPGDVYGEIARTLGKLGDLRAVEPLMGVLKAEMYLSRQAAVEGLCQLGDRRAVPGLMQAMSDESSLVREAAVKGLDKFRAPESIGHLIEALSDAAPAVRQSANEILVHMAPQVIQVLMPSLQAQDWRIRLNAVQIIGRIGDVRAVPVLIERLRDPAGNVCGAVNAELKKLCDVRAVGPLLKALEDRDPYIRESAATLLNGLGDANTLPRRVLAEARLSERDRIAILDYMRRVRYMDKHLTLRYNITDVAAFCQQMRGDSDPTVHAGAMALLPLLAQPQPVS